MGYLSTISTSVPSIHKPAWKTVSDWVTQKSNNHKLVYIGAESSDEQEEPAQAEIRPLMSQFYEYHEPVLDYDDQKS